jgi:transposase-like protein
MKTEAARCMECGTEWAINLDGERPFICPNCKHVYTRKDELSELQKLRRGKKTKPIIFTDKEQETIRKWVDKGTRLSDTLVVPLNDEEGEIRSKLFRVLELHREKGIMTYDARCPQCGSETFGKTLLPSNYWNGCRCNDCGTNFKTKFDSDFDMWESIPGGITPD